MATWTIRFKESAHENHHCDIRLLLHFIGKVQQADKELLVFERVFQVAITGVHLSPTSAYRTVALTRNTGSTRGWVWRVY
jgi:hypothetical protein